MAKRYGFFSLKSFEFCYIIYKRIIKIQDKFLHKIKINSKFTSDFTIFFSSQYNKEIKHKKGKYSKFFMFENKASENRESDCFLSIFFLLSSVVVNYAIQFAGNKTGFYWDGRCGFRPKSNMSFISL